MPAIQPRLATQSCVVLLQLSPLSCLCSLLCLVFPPVLPNTRLTRGIGHKPSPGDMRKAFPQEICPKPSRGDRYQEFTGG